MNLDAPRFPFEDLPTTIAGGVSRPDDVPPLRVGELAALALEVTVGYAKAGGYWHIGEL